jgi:hypothetical protein
MANVRAKTTLNDFMSKSATKCFQTHVPSFEMSKNVYPHSLLIGERRGRMGGKEQGEEGTRERRKDE